MCQPTRDIGSDLKLTARLVGGNDEPLTHRGRVLPGARESGPEKRKIAWHVRLLDATRSAEAVVRVWSQKAGTVTRQVKLAPGDCTNSAWAKTQRGPESLWRTRLWLRNTAVAHLLP